MARRIGAAALGVWAIAGAGAGGAMAATLTVGAAGSGADFTSIQDALEAAVAGDHVVVHEKPVPYFERLEFPRSGNAVDGHITLRAALGETPVLDASTLKRDRPMIEIDSRSYLRIIGLELQNNRDGFGIEAYGRGSHIEVRNNHIHHMRGVEAGGIGFLGEKAQPYSQIVVDGNYIHDNAPAESETLVLNGNVSDFEITNNLLVDNNNIGIDLIGGERDVNPDPDAVARNGVVRGNVVIRSNASYGGGFGAGIYVDGGRDIVIENNRVTGCDYGIEVAAENKGLVTSGIVVRNNVVHGNEKAGIVFGGFEKSVGRANDNVFTGNVLYHNNTLGKKGKGRFFEGNGVGELYVQFGKDNVVRNNIIVAGPENVVIAYDSKAGDKNTIDHNLYWSPDIASAKFFLAKQKYKGFAAWQAGSGKDASSLAGDPLFADAAGTDFHVLPGSPAIDAGDPDFALSHDGERDLDGEGRLVGAAVDIGADEAGPGCPEGEGTGALCSRDRGQVAPGSLLVYYGFPSLINGSAGDLDAAAAELAQHDFVVLGAGLERPAGEGGSDDHEETVAIVAKPALADTRVFGYVPLGVLTGNLSEGEIESRIDAWMDDVGVDGIFFDEFGYDFCVSRARQNAAVDYVKANHPGAPVVANAYQPDDALGDAVTAAAPNPSCGAFTPNPDATPSHLDAGDFILLESHQVVLGAYESESAWQARAEALRAHQERMGIGVWSVTTSADGDAFDPAKFAYAWASAALYGHAATGWGEYAFGAIPSAAPFRTPPALDPGAERIGPILASDSIYRVATDAGVLSVDAGSHSGQLDPLPPAGPCSADCSAFHVKLKLKAKPLVKAKQWIDLHFEEDGEGGFTGAWDDVALAGSASGEQGKRSLELDPGSAAAVYAWLDDLAGEDVAIEARKQPKVVVKRKNATQARLVLELPFRALRGRRVEKGTVKLEVLGAARD
ncbi:MAG: right-handed parallel beta-helix repeat-containing protein [Myxococcota bacterium]